MTGLDIGSHCSNMELNNMNLTHIPKIAGEFVLVYVWVLFCWLVLLLFLNEKLL